jgi:hypothetical protein
MPMPVSAILGERHADPHLAALGVLQRVRDEVAQDLRHLALIRVDRRHTLRFLEHQSERLVDQQRPQHPPKRAEQRRHLERRGTNLDLPGFDLRQVEQIVDEIGELLRRLADVVDLVLLIAVRAETVGQQIDQRQNRVHRRPELVGHVRQEPRLHFVGAAKMIGAFVELGVECDDAAVGVFELTVQPHQLLLSRVQIVERTQELLVLLLHFFNRTRGSLRGKRFGEPAYLFGRQEPGPARQELLEHHDRAVPARSDREMIDQAARADDAESHPRPGSIAAAEDVGEV